MGDVLLEALADGLFELLGAVGFQESQQHGHGGPQVFPALGQAHQQFLARGSGALEPVEPTLLAGLPCRGEAESSEYPLSPLLMEQIPWKLKRDSAKSKVTTPDFKQFVSGVLFWFFVASFFCLFIHS